MTALRTLEGDSIRSFVASCGDLFRGARVLDYGCGQQPYRDLIESFGAEYVGWDRAIFPGNAGGTDEGQEHPLREAWQVVLCTQVLQYLPMPRERLTVIGRALRLHGGALVLTYPTTWPEVEEADLHRFTRSGMERLLAGAGFTVERHERRAEFVWQGETFALGYGVVARA